jgi:hypothetical protein
MNRRSFIGGIVAACCAPLAMMKKTTATMRVVENTKQAKVIPGRLVSVNGFQKGVAWDGGKPDLYRIIEDVAKEYPKNRVGLAEIIYGKQVI